MMMVIGKKICFDDGFLLCAFPCYFQVLLGSQWLECAQNAHFLTFDCVDSVILPFDTTALDIKRGNS